MVDPWEKKWTGVRAGPVISWAADLKIAIKYELFGAILPKDWDITNLAVNAIIAVFL